MCIYKIIPTVIYAYGIHMELLPTTSSFTVFFLFVAYFRAISYHQQQSASLDGSTCFVTFLPSLKKSWWKRSPCSSLIVLQLFEEKVKMCINELHFQRHIATLFYVYYQKLINSYTIVSALPLIKKFQQQDFQSPISFPSITILKVSFTLYYSLLF